jgi:hypothetical protein
MILDAFLENNPILLPYGCACLIAHIVLYILFKYVFYRGPWTDVPSFTAHQVIAFFLMIQWTVIGFQNLSDAAAASSSSSSSSSSELDYQRTTASSFSSSNALYDGYRVLRRFPAGIDMAQRSMGALWIWDIPISVFSKDMGGSFDLLMHAHHMGMLLITCIVLGVLSFDYYPTQYGDGGGVGGGWPVASSYAPVFLGVIELSSIPLQIVDLFHPKKAPGWCDYMQKSPFLSTVNELARTSFAVLFLAVRGIYFPYMIVTTVLPECWIALTGLWYSTSAPTPPPICLPIAMILIFAMAFTSLQLHWATLVVKQIVKAISAKNNDHDHDGGSGGDVNVEKRKNQ